ncbi:hypothetical protein [Planomicrobium sp. Y74]|uniref:hypothetical protein n=1 Tax=Planomicrobium sp. Y74 TaxID=2478977 RepID=UPI000EF468CB|nr:hypothetical protein [Planomicrobium sp. Y74]RLQ91376.1 hypothetical protein D9754_06510 [Planomicrobium sp. Y74]
MCFPFDKTGLLIRQDYQKAYSAKKKHSKKAGAPSIRPYSGLFATLVILLTRLNLRQTGKPIEIRLAA